jgi:hypothetical protein
METKGYLELSELYSSIYNEVSESHYKVGDKVLSKSGGMKGEVVKVDSEESGDYYTVKSEDGKTAKYSPDELEKNNESPEEQKEETDLFVYILEYLVAEGYADTNENALAIMENMSEEWKESIVESKQPYPAEKVARKREAVKKKEDIATYQRRDDDAEKLYKRGVALALKKKMGDIGRG